MSVPTRVNSSATIPLSTTEPHHPTIRPWKGMPPIVISPPKYDNLDAYTGTRSFAPISDIVSADVVVPPSSIVFSQEAQPTVTPFHTSEFSPFTPDIRDEEARVLAASEALRRGVIPPRIL